MTLRLRSGQALRNVVSRRRLLKGLGGITFGLPWLEQLHGARAQTATPTGPRRVIVMSYEMGVPLGQWRPSTVGTGFELPFVSAPLDPFKDRCLFVSSIDNTMLASGGESFIWGHPGKKEAALTGTLTTGAFPTANTNQLAEVLPAPVTTGGANGPSVEHLIGQALRTGQALPSVDLGVDGSCMAPWGGAEQYLPSAFSFEGQGNPISLNAMPHLAFDSLFAGLDDGTMPSEAQLALQRVRARRKSVLDAVRDSFTDLATGLGSDDRVRLEEHAARIRQIELDLAASASCSRPTTPEAVMSYQGWSMDRIAALQIPILAHAMGCDLAPVGRLEFTLQQNPRFGIAELDAALDAAGDMYDWHAMVHGDPLPGTTTFLRPGRGEDLAYDNNLLLGYRFFVEQFAALLTALDEIPEGPDTSVLDNSLLILASDLGEGLGHGHMKMGYVLAGNLGPARRGYHFDGGPTGIPFEVGGQYFYADASYNVNQLLNSILDMAGVTDGDGNPVTMGLGGYLESLGAPRRIDGLFG
jgi:hypothetical protein